MAKLTLSTLFILSTSDDPEALADWINAAITSAIMGLDTDVLLMGSSVKCLSLNQGREAQERLQQLKDFGVKHVYVEAAALQAFALHDHRLALDVTRLQPDSLKSLVTSRDQILNF